MPVLYLLSVDVLFTVSLLQLAIFFVMYFTMIHILHANNYCIAALLWAQCRCSCSIGSCPGFRSLVVAHFYIVQHTSPLSSIFIAHRLYIVWLYIVVRILMKSNCGVGSNNLDSIRAKFNWIWIQCTCEQRNPGLSVVLSHPFIYQCFGNYSLLVIV